MASTEHNSNIDIRSEHWAINDYLDEMSSHLRGFLPDLVRECVISETLDVFEQSVERLELDGTRREDAVTHVLAERESPEVRAMRMLEYHFESDIDSPLINKLGRANLIALTLFGIGNMLYLILLQLQVYVPSVAPISLNLNPAVIRPFWPEPLPFPELNLPFAIVVGYPLVAPILLGWGAGKMIPVRAAGSVFWAVMPLIIGSFLVGLMLLPNKLVLLYSIALTLYWLPVGSLAAHLSSLRLRRKRRR